MRLDRGLGRRNFAAARLGEDTLDMTILTEDHMGHKLGQLVVVVDRPVIAGPQHPVLIGVKESAFVPISVMLPGGAGTAGVGWGSHPPEESAFPRRTEEGRSYLGYLTRKNCMGPPICR